LYFPDIIRIREGNMIKERLVDWLKDLKERKPDRYKQYVYALKQMIRIEKEALEWKRYIDMDGLPTWEYKDDLMYGLMEEGYPPVMPWTLTPLELRGFVRTTYRSRAHHRRVLVDREETEEALKELGEL